LSAQSHEFLQLYLYVVSIVCSLGPKPVFALYSHDERPRKTIGARHDLEESVRRPGLGIFRHSVSHFFIILL